MQFDFTEIVRKAWDDYGATIKIKDVTDISVQVSTNHVYKITFEDRTFIIAKLSYFGVYEHFVEDHSIINSLSINLPYPYDNVLSRSLMKKGKLYVYRHQTEWIDAWVVFYRPVKMKKLLPPRLNEYEIKKLGVQLAHFHKACHSVRGTLSPSTKSVEFDMNHLLEILETEKGQFKYKGNIDDIKKQVGLLFENMVHLDTDSIERIPVFVDWNIGNFSVTPGMRLFSRWDYDWFRMSSRVMDFYFLSRVVSDIGDKTIWTYNVSPLMEDRFILFLQSYHKVYPLTEREIRLLKEVYRFFILNYVVKYGGYFFNDIYAQKFKKEAFENYLPSIDTFDPEVLLRALKL